MVMIMVKFCAVSPSKNENRGLPLRKTGDCPDPDRTYRILESRTEVASDP